MHITNLLVPALSLLAPVLAGAVLDLTPSNFDSEVFNGKPSLVEFFAPWCGHCKSLAPVYEDLASSYSASKDVLIAKVDADEHKSLGTKYGVSGFPTIKWFDGTSKDPIDYSGGRDLESLQKWVAEKSGAKAKRAVKAPSEVKMLGDNDFEKEIGGDKGVFVAFTAPWCGHCKTLAPTWETLATDFSGDQDAVTIAKVDAEANAKVATTFGVSGYPTIKYFPAGTKEPVDYKGGRDIKSLVNYINEQAGTHRTPGGSLDTSAGTVEVLDNLVKGVTGKTLDEVIEQVSKTSKDVQDAGKEYYIKVLQKLKENTGYAEKEETRLQGLLRKGGLSRAKEDDLTKRLNVLRKFIKGDLSVEDAKEEL